MTGAQKAWAKQKPADLARIAELESGPDQCLQLADVTVSSELKTQGLVNALFEQSVEVARAALVPGRFLEVTRRDPGQRRSRKATYTPGSAQWERDRDAYDAKLLTAEASEASQEMR